MKYLMPLHIQWVSQLLACKGGDIDELVTHFPMID